MCRWVECVNNETSGGAVCLDHKLDVGLPKPSQRAPACKQPACPQQLDSTHRWAGHADSQGEQRAVVQAAVVGQHAWRGAVQQSVGEALQQLAQGGDARLIHVPGGWVRGPVI